MRRPLKVTESKIWQHKQNHFVQMVLLLFLSSFFVFFGLGCGLRTEKLKGEVDTKVP